METAVAPGKLCFTIPDSAVIEHQLEVGEFISTLSEFGCRFSLEEFGSGQKNYDYIKEIQIDFVTVKSTFVNDAKNDPKDFAMAKSINELVHFMGKKTIARQPRTGDIGETIKEIGIDFVHDLKSQSVIELPTA